VYEKVVEVPVCDLLVAVHCPNLRLGGSSFGSDSGSFCDGRSISMSASGCGDAEIATRLPYRQDSSGNLPRMLLRVSDLATFPAVVMYMHTRDRARLIRQVVGEHVWRAIGHFYDPEVSEVAHVSSHNSASKGSSSSVVVALRLALEEVPYTEIVNAGAAVLALEKNLQDVGLQEKPLLREVERLRRALVKAVNGKSKGLGAGDEDGFVGVGKEDGYETSLESEEEREGGGKEEVSSRWKLRTHLSFSSLGSGWGLKLVPCVPTRSEIQ
jgi:hypothetical protein